MAAHVSVANPLPYLVKRETGGLHTLKSKLFDERLRVAKNLFKKDLVCHYGCVNAIEFSDNGELLLSGGDDRRVVLWKFGESLLNHGQPEIMAAQHLSNIFCLSITPDNTRIYSGGNDDQVIVHDTQTKRIVELLPHQKAVCGVSIDPHNSRIIATAGNDGRLLVFDTRQSVDESLVLSRSRRAFHGVVFHPSQSGCLAAANAQDGTTLWDLRKPKYPVLRYGGPEGVTQNCMSVCFDSQGSRILALRRRLPPVLYSIGAPQPLVHFYHPDYYNSCTMKSCCFAGDKDQFVLSGSDDFNLYMWRIPDGEGVWVDDTHMVLHGHRSIVNQVRYNPQYCVIASSGVEKIIKTWSPLEIPGSRGALLEEQAGNENPRTVYSHEEYVSLVYNSGAQYISHNYTDQSTSEDPRMMAFFDSLVQREIEGWSAEATDSQSAGETTAMTARVTGVTTRMQAAINTANRRRRTSRRYKDTEDSSDSDQLLVDFLPLPPKRANNNSMRNPRVQNRIARLIATRQSKLLQLARKRAGPRSSRRPKPSTSTSTPLRTARAPPVRSRERRLPPRRAPAALAPLEGERPSSSEEEEEPFSTPRPTHHRQGSKMSRSNRRRMNMPRSYDRKNKSLVFRGNRRPSRKGGLSNGMNSNHLETLGDSTFSEDNLAVPSTSTGIRSHQSAPLFRIAEADSDDDQSGGSRSKSPPSSAPATPVNPEDLPLVSILPTPINGSREDLKMEPQQRTYRVSGMTRSNQTRFAGFHSSNASSSVQTTNLEEWESNDGLPAYLPALVRLMNETNESEVESSCSTVEEIASPPKKRIAHVEPATPDSGIQTEEPSGSSNRKVQKDNLDNSDDPDWAASKYRQRVKRARRNYFTRFSPKEDSDST